MSAIRRPATLDELREVLRAARRRGQPVGVCGGRHAGGGQQFLTDRTLLDTSRLTRVLQFDADNGQVEVEAGIRWPALFAALRGASDTWAVHQKQGGADEMSLGGAVAANIHGRCLASRPIVQDVEAVTLLEPGGERVRCSRTENAERFRHVVGGYGMFGLVYSVRLRLVPRAKLVKRVRWTGVDEAVAMLEEQAKRGALHGDFQYAVDEQACSFLTEGLLSWYEPTDAAATVNPAPPGAAAAAFANLAALAHHDKPAALAAYREAMLATDGAVNSSDAWQAGDYLSGYHQAIDALSRGGGGPGSEILTEIYVPRSELPAYMWDCARWLRDRGANLIYGTVRLIRCDDETALAWAKEDYACVIFNLHTALAPAAVQGNAETIRGLLDRAIGRGGSYYLTYHRFARRDQVLACYPQLPAVLRAKERYDPEGRFQSDWFRYYRRLLDA